MCMSFFSRLLGPRRDPREELRPLWHRVVEISREPHWYARAGVADSVAGRFDMISVVLALVLLRMENDPDLAPRSALLTELFVEDMDGQLRETGVGDLMVGKHIGKLMSVLGGRLGALRKGLADDHETPLAAALERNITLGERADPQALAQDVRTLARMLAHTPSPDILEGRIGP